ncbi:MAG: hypothetical protein VX944_02470 [Myxococcota bacterium]|jgi:hypothetical protein|nr:hypothetical protein [Myxococcota bacterium]MEC9388913.1 hypothetical protein [Myxococcota bacterium]
MSNDALMDVRTVQRNIQAGKVSEDEYRKYLESLEDCADEAEETETQMILHKADEDDADA